ncbi:MAG: tetratricopeptide repeat protein, partial [Candidatus Omnitrophica bacterium]|nr:tetratricopeptide repeat protein [Candidatus Omnitrophota bacterium]
SLALLIFVILYFKEGKGRWLAVSFGAFAAAVLCREVAVVNAVYVFLVSFCFTRDFKKALKAFLPFFVLGLLYYGIRTFVFPIASYGITEKFLFKAGNGIGLAGVSILHFFLPASILAIFPKGILAATLLALCFFGIVTAKLFRSKNFSEDILLVGLSILWIALVALPIFVAQGLMARLGPVLSEHFLYFSSVGFVLLLAFILDHFPQSFIQKLLITGIMIYFIVVGGINGYFWQSEEMLLRHVQRIEQKGFTVSDEQIAMRFSDDEEKVKQLQQRASTSSIRSLWIKRLGNIYHKQRKYPEAMKVLEEAVRLNPSNIEALNEWGVVCLETADKKKGFSLLMQSLNIDPYAADTCRLLGTAFYRQGDFANAVIFLRRAVVYGSDESEASLFLMMAYFFSKDQAGYLDALEQAARRFPDDRLILRFAANEFFNHGYFAQTAETLSSTARLFADDPQTLELLRESKRRLSLAQMNHLKQEQPAIKKDKKNNKKFSSGFSNTN